MNKVNLLPDWYLQQQLLKRKLWLRSALLIMVAAGMAIWTWTEKIRVRQLTQQFEVLAYTPDSTLQDTHTSLLKKEGEIRQLHNLQLAYHDIGNTIPMSALVQQIQNNLTPGMALSRVAIDVRNEPVKSASDANNTPTITNTPPKMHEVAHITVLGIAPNGVVIAQMIDRLQTNPLIGDLVLNFARNEILRDYTVRRFEIQMTVDLDRLAIPPSSLDKKLAEGPNVH